VGFLDPNPGERRCSGGDGETVIYVRGRADVIGVVQPGANGAETCLIAA